MDVLKFIGCNWDAESGCQWLAPSELSEEIVNGKQISESDLIFVIDIDMLSAKVCLRY